jgi:hypothetical protein
MQKAPNKRSIKLRMFDSPESASLWFDIFNGILFTGAFLVFVGTWGTIKTAGIKERYSDERIAANEAETKRAIADSDTAKEGTAKANEAIAVATQRAAALENEAAQARVEQERLKQIVAWRNITKNVGEKLVSILAKSPAVVRLSYVASDPEALGLAIQFSKVFEAAHWQAIPSAMTFSTQLVFEIRLPGPENETVQLLRSAFTQAGITFSTEEVPPSTMNFSSSGPTAPTAVVFIGSKRPPF